MIFAWLLLALSLAAWTWRLPTWRMLFFTSLFHAVFVALGAAQFDRGLLQGSLIYEDVFATNLFPNSIEELFLLQVIFSLVAALIVALRRPQFLKTAAERAPTAAPRSIWGSRREWIRLAVLAGGLLVLWLGARILFPS